MSENIENESGREVNEQVKVRVAIVLVGGVFMFNLSCLFNSVL